MKYCPNQKYQQGFSLVELLIALILSATLLIMCFSLYFSTKKAEQLSVGVVNTETQVRNALHLIRQSVEHAGFITEIGTSTPLASVFPANDRFSAGQVIEVTDNGERLLVRMQGDKDKPLRSCNGQVIAPAINTLTETWHEYFLEEVTPEDQPTQTRLMCQVYVDGVAQSEPILVAQPIIALRFRSFASNSDATRIVAEPTAQPIKGVHIQFAIRSKEQLVNEPRQHSITLFGFDTINRTDRYYYSSGDHYFLAQNQ